jgi:hypothetical protein
VVVVRVSLVDEMFDGNNKLEMGAEIVECAQRSAERQNERSENKLQAS